MFFKDFLSKIRERNKKRLVIRELIINLGIDQTQKELYLESLDILDDSLLDSFYEKLQSVIGNFEKKLVIIEHEKTSSTINSVRDKEKQDRTEEFKNFNILLDNI